MVRKVFILLFFGLQVWGIVYARFTSVRYFCWAPYDQISQYEIRVDLNGSTLSSDAIEARYRIQAKGRENRSIHNVMALIRCYEQSYGKDDSAQVELHYTSNGKKAKVWYWKNP